MCPCTFIRKSITKISTCFKQDYFCVLLITIWQFNQWIIQQSVYHKLYIISHINKYKYCECKTIEHVKTNITYQQYRCELFSLQQDVLYKDITNKCLSIAQLQYRSIDHNHSIIIIQQHRGIHKLNSIQQMCHTSQFHTYKLFVQKHFQPEIQHKIFKNNIPLCFCEK
jgi:hypothetical protein